MKYTDKELQASFCKIVNAFVTAYNQKHNLSIKLPLKVKFDLELTKPECLASAVTRAGVDTIKVNMTCCRVEPDLFLNCVAAHEVAHIAQNVIDAKEGKASPSHGIRWMNLMKSMHQEPIAKIPYTAKLKQAVVNAREVKRTKTLLLFQPDQAEILRKRNHATN